MIFGGVEPQPVDEHFSVIAGFEGPPDVVGEWHSFEVKLWVFRKHDLCRGEPFLLRRKVERIKILVGDKEGEVSFIRLFIHDH